MSKKLKPGDIIDLRLGMDITSGLAQDGKPKFFRAYRKEGEVEVPLRTVVASSTAGSMRQAIAGGQVTEAKARYKRTYTVQEFDLIVGGVPIGMVEERSE